MPQGASHYRGKQLALLQQLKFEQQTSKDYEKLLLESEKETDSLPMSDFRKRHVYLARKKFDQLKCYPAKLVEDIALAESQGLEFWEKARKSNDFKRSVSFIVGSCNPIYVRIKSVTNANVQCVKKNQNILIHLFVQNDAQW